MKYSDYYDKVLEHGISVFDEKEKFFEWLDCFSSILGDKPFNIMNSSEGLEVIDSLLDKIEKFRGG